MQSTIQSLSDAELDAVTGGLLNNIGINIGTMANVSETLQESTNVGILSLQLGTGNQSSRTVQVNSNG